MFGFLKPKVKIAHLPYCCEVHSHILPGVDDGFKNVDDSTQILRQFQKDGITHVAFTPHIDPGMFPKNTKPFLQERFKDFVKALPQDINMNFHLAGEYMCDDQMKTDEPILHFHDSSVLIEMSYFYVSPYIKEIIFGLMNEGFKPILAHPERYVYLAGQWEVYENYRDMGCRFQLNLLSLSGAYGPESKMIIRHLLEQDMYRYTGTDAHSIRQYMLIRNTEIPRKQAEEVEELMHNNRELFP